MRTWTIVTVLVALVVAGAHAQAPPPSRPPGDGGSQAGPPHGPPPGGQGMQRPGGGPGMQRPGGGPGMQGPGGPGMQGPGGPGMQGPGGPGMRGPGMQRPDGPGMPPGPGGPFGGPGGRGGFGPRDEDQGPPPDWQPSEEITSQLKKSEPEYSAALARWKSSEPERWRGEMWQVETQRRHSAEMRTRGEGERAGHVDQVAALERKVRALVDGLPRHDGEARNSGLHEARAALGQLFDAREVMRLDEVAQLEKRIADVRSSLAERRSKKDEIVDRRLREMLGGEDPLGW